MKRTVTARLGTALRLSAALGLLALVSACHYYGPGAHPGWGGPVWSGYGYGGHGYGGHGYGGPGYGRPGPGPRRDWPRRHRHW